MMPDNAKVVVDTNVALYFARSCAINNTHQFLRAASSLER
jgi:CMP-2-keto-3-deoxyoctulosonic acid synthetase